MGREFFERSMPEFGFVEQFLSVENLHGTRRT
jgi:hypothetical protein